MEKNLALKIIFGISIAGLLFSGYLSYTEVFTETCPLGACSTAILSVPVCVYGFVMYLAVFIVSLMGIKSRK